MKKVRFSDHVEVKSMSVDKATHAQEVKNPATYRPPSRTASPKSIVKTRSVGPHPEYALFSMMPWWCWAVLALGLFLLIMYFVFYRKKKRSSSEVEAQA